MVKPGESLSVIAARYGLSSTKLADYNGITKPNLIRVGQKLLIPLGKVVPPPPLLDAAILKELNRITPKRGKWKRIVIHHSATNVDDAVNMHNVHKARGMENGLAYHFVIGNGVKTTDGKIYIGDRWKRQIRGGHLASTALNEVAIGICLIGNFEKTLPTAKQRTSLKTLVSHLRKRTGVPFSQVRTHRHINPKPTICPGRRFSLRSILST